MREDKVVMWGLILFVLAYGCGFIKFPGIIQMPQNVTGTSFIQPHETNPVYDSSFRCDTSILQYVCKRESGSYTAVRTCSLKINAGNDLMYSYCLQFVDKNKIPMSFTCYSFDRNSCIPAAAKQNNIQIIWG